MRHVLGIAVFATYCFLSAALGEAGPVEVRVGGCDLVDERSGTAAIVLELEMPELRGFSVTRALLIADEVASLQGETVDVWVRALRGDNSIEPQITARTSLRTSLGRLSCDLTNVFQCAADGMEFDRVHVSLPEWRGEDLPEGLARALHSVLSEAVIELDGAHPVSRDQGR